MSIAMQHGLSLFGDVFWIAALSLMGGCSRWAWKQIKPDARIPIHWNRRGLPTLRVGRLVSLVGLVILAFAVGCYMKAESLSLKLGADTLIMRLTAAPLFAAIHLIQVRRGMLTLAQEGQLKP